MENVKKCIKYENTQDSVLSVYEQYRYIYQLYIDV